MSRIAYDLRKIRAIVFDIDGVLSPAVVPLGPDGTPQRMANLRDGYAMVCGVKAGLKFAIISGAEGEALKKRFSIIGIKDIYLGAGQKLEILKQWMADNDLQPDQVAYVGDDIPDLECMKYAGLPVAPRDAAPECRQMARYITAANGGYGVGREIVEEVLRAQNKWPGTAAAFGS